MSIELYVNLPMGTTIRCVVMHKNYLIILNKEEFAGDLVQLDISEFDVILGMEVQSKD